MLKIIVEDLIYRNSFTLSFNYKYCKSSYSSLPILNTMQ